MASPQLELLRCATASPEMALELWERLVKATPVEDFDYQAQRMLPAVWVNLKKASKNFADEARLRGLHRRTWIHNKRLVATAGRVLDLFGGLEIPTIVLKGLAYNELFYRDSGFRPSWDFDLLVPIERAREALRALENDGWEFKEERLDPLERMEHGTTLRKNGVELDLHWNLMREARNPEHDAVFWKEAQSLTLDGRSALTLSPTHQLFYLLAIANREPENRCRYLLDLAFLTRALGASIDYAQVPAMLRERHISSRLRSLPLEEIGLEQLKVGVSPSLLDRLWSQSSGYVFDGSHEWYYLAYPLLDYWFHFRGRAVPGWSLAQYLKRRLKVDSLGDFLLRTARKLSRLTRLLWR